MDPVTQGQKPLVGQAGPVTALPVMAVLAVGVARPELRAVLLHGQVEPVERPGPALREVLPISLGWLPEQDTGRWDERSP